MTDPLDPDDSKVYFGEPTTALGSALGPEDVQVLHTLLLGPNCQYELRHNSLSLYVPLRVTDPLGPDDSKVYFDKPTTALGSALGPEDVQVLHTLLLGPNCQYELRHNSLSLYVPLRVTDPLGPDDSKVYFDKPTTALGSALGPEDVQVLHTLLLGLTSQFELHLRGDGHIVYISPILRGDGVPFDDIPPRVQLEHLRPGVAIQLQRGMLIPGRDGRWNISYQNDPDGRIEKHVLVVLRGDYEVFPPNPDVNYSVA